MANGYNRVSELARFTGYPKNKCDKYIKALIEFDFVKKIIGSNGYAKYYLENEYLSLWCGVILTAVPNADGTFESDVQESFMKYLNENFLSDIYKDMCHDWLKDNIYSLSVSYIDVDEDTCRDVKVGGITFDFVCTKGTTYYAYFNTVPGDNLTMKLWADIEKATTKAAPFYKNEYIICSVNRIPDGYWKLSKQYDNVHIVKLESLYACFMEDYNRSVHPRFVPSFVRNWGY